MSRISRSFEFTQVDPTITGNITRLIRSLMPSNKPDPFTMKQVGPYIEYKGNFDCITKRVIEWVLVTHDRASDLSHDADVRHLYPDMEFVFSVLCSESVIIIAGSFEYMIGDDTCRYPSMDCNIWLTQQGYQLTVSHHDRWQKLSSMFKFKNL